MTGQAAAVALVSLGLAVAQGPEPAPPALTAAALLGRIAAAEEASPFGRLTLAITEHRGVYRARETPAETRDRLTRGPGTTSTGSFLFGPSGWRKELSTPGATGRPATVLRAAEQGGALRLYLEARPSAGSAAQPQRLGRLARAATVSPADALLSHRAAKSLEGVSWEPAASEAGRIVLRARRGTERHRLEIDLSEPPVIRSWELVRSLSGPGGEKLEQTYRCEWTPAAGGTLGRLEEWILNPPPADNAAHRVTEVRAAEFPQRIPPEDLLLRFPAGAIVTDARGEVPIEFEQTGQGVDEDAVARTAALLAARRATAGQAAPPFTLKSTTGEEVRLEALRGSPVLIYWFSSRSAPAAAGAAWLRSTYDRYRKRGVKVLAIAVAEEGDALAAAEGFRKKHRWSFPVLVDGEGLTLTLFGLETGVPKAAVVDGDGVLLYERAGLDGEAVHAVLERLAPDRK